MGTILIILTLITSVVLVICLLRFRTLREASRIARESSRFVMSVWGLQGPFESGTDSADAMRRAYIAVMGKDRADEMTDSLAAHESAFNQDPKAWEDTRRLAVETASQDAVTLAEGIALAEGLNKNVAEGTGHRLEFAKSPDGSTRLVQRQIWTDDETNARKERDTAAIALAIGRSIVNDRCQEARKPHQFLVDRFFQDAKVAPDDMAIGKAWLTMFSMENEEPNSEIVKTFKRLNDAHAATLPDTDE